MEEPDSAVIATSLEWPDAFGALFDRHGGVLLRFLMRRVAPADAEGLLGEVFRIAFERRGDFELERASARPWLYGIATNVVAKHHRSEARRLRATARLAARPEPVSDPADPAVSALDAQATWRRVAEAVTALPEAERAVLLLYSWEELSYDEIAETLEVPVGTVRSRLHRARTRLRSLTERAEDFGVVGRTQEPEAKP